MQQDGVKSLQSDRVAEIEIVPPIIIIIIIIIALYQWNAATWQIWLNIYVTLDNNVNDLVACKIKHPVYKHIFSYK